MNILIPDIFFVYDTSFVYVFTYKPLTKLNLLKNTTK